MRRDPNELFIKRVRQIRTCMTRIVVKRKRIPTVEVECEVKSGTKAHKMEMPNLEDISRRGNNFYLNK